MEPRHESIGFYYFKNKNDFKKLKFRITLEQFSPTQLLQKFHLDFGSGDVFKRKSGKEQKEKFDYEIKNSQSEPEKSFGSPESIEVAWQKKLLSPCERIQDSKLTNKKGKRKSDRGKTRSIERALLPRLFTYVNEEQYDPSDSLDDNKPDNRVNRNENVSRKRYGTKVPQIESQFFIMADLSPEERLGEGAGEQVVLCKMTYNSAGELRVEPDFWKIGQPNKRINGLGKDCTIYEYSIYLHMPNIEREIISKQTHVEKDWIRNFERPSGDTIRFIFAGEVSRTLNFTETSCPLYIRYSLHLPTGWNTEDDLEAISEACSPLKTKDGNVVCHFSLPFSFLLESSISCASDFPWLLFAVYSKEYLTNDIDIGYGALELKLRENVLNDDEIEIKTWFPLPKSPLGQLHRYFLGGSQNYDSLVNNIPLKRGTSVDWLGVNAVSSGSLFIRLHSLVQTNFQED